MEHASEAADDVDGDTITPRLLDALLSGPKPSCGSFLKFLPEDSVVVNDCFFSVLQ